MSIRREALQFERFMRDSSDIAAVSAPAVNPIAIRFGRLGDMVLLGPLLNLLHRRYGNPCWLIGSGPWSRQLYGGQEDVARIWSLVGRHTPLLLGPTWWRVIWALRHSGKSPIYVCETSASHALKRINALLRLARIEPERCVFLRENDADANEHRVDGLLRFGKQTPPALQAEAYPWVNVVPAAAVGSPLIVLFGENAPRKWMPRGVYGAPVLALGGPPDARHVDDISVQAVFEAWRSLPRRSAVFPAGRTSTDPDFKGNLC